jgi:biotin carboxyl carrier protein
MGQDAKGIDRLDEARTGGISHRRRPHDDSVLSIRDVASEIPEGRLRYVLPEDIFQTGIPLSRGKSRRHCCSDHGSQGESTASTTCTEGIVRSVTTECELMEKETTRHISLDRNEYLVSVGGLRYRVALTGTGTATVNHVRHAFDLKETPEGATSFILNGTVFEVAVLARKIAQRVGTETADGSEIVRVSVNGTDFEATVDDQRSMLIKSLMKAHAHDVRTVVVKAPMPGLIVRIEVEPGQNIAAGQGLIVLEAMKMENELRSLQEGTVQEIFVKEGRAVEKDERLLVISAH